MNIVVAVKIVPDDQDIKVESNRELDYTKARPVVSTYDLNAIEGAAQLASAQGAKLTAISVGGDIVKDSKVAKNILARGVDEYITISDDSCENMEAFLSAKVLASAVNDQVPFDLIVCGDGSADQYAQQVDVQLAEALGVPIINAVSSIAFEGEKLIVERVLETEKETVEVVLPAVISVVPDVALPRICGMKEILAAGKKPVKNITAEQLGVNVVPSIQVLDTLAPIPTDRKLAVFDLSVDGDIDKFVTSLQEAIR